MHISCYISSKDEEYKCHFTWAWNGKYKTFKLPNIIPPYKKRVKGSYIGGNDKLVNYDYEQIIPRQYGFYLDQEFICFYYGINAGESNIDQKISFTLPWLDQTYVKKEYYNLDGTVYTSVPHINGINSPFWDICREIEQTIPKIKFTFNDFDGEEVEGECFLVKQFYTRGSGLFKWLKYITKTKGFLRAEVNYNKEVGQKKNSWKGGTLSCSFYCKDESLTIEQILQNYAKEEKFKNLKII
jgi:hypothetical protein